MAPEERAREAVAGPGRLDAVVAALAGVPRAEVQRAIAEGLVTVDGAPRPKSHRLAGGERLRFSLPGERGLAGEGPPVPVRYEDPHVLVVAKEAGLPTHPTAGRRSGTLVNRLIGMAVPLAPAGGELRPGIVHRLDAGTSGLMIVAKTDEAYGAFAALLRRREVDRRYLALVRGAVEHDAFTVEAPLGRRGPRITVTAGSGRPAATSIRVRERLARSTLIEAAPRTGRTHQIRVHLASVGHPILGDRAYGGGGDDARELGLARPFLHSWRLGFVHPLSGARVELEETLPPELAEALRRARAGAGRSVRLDGPGGRAR
jgi:23S rRNA pseudouridine1911/1915/1917 synthase